MILLFTFINILLALIDANIIKKGERINHLMNAVIYSLMLVIIFILGATINEVIAALIIRIPVFNTSLNIFRGLRYDYVSADPESIIDRMALPIIDLFGYDNYNLFIILIAILIT